MMANITSIDSINADSIKTTDINETTSQNKFQSKATSNLKPTKNPTSNININDKNKSEIAEPSSTVTMNLNLKNSKSTGQTNCKNPNSINCKNFKESLSLSFTAPPQSSQITHSNTSHLKANPNVDGLVETATKPSNPTTPRGLKRRNNSDESINNCNNDEKDDEAEVRVIFRLIVEEQVIYRGKVEKTTQIECEELSRTVSKVAWGRKLNTSTTTQLPTTPAVSPTCSTIDVNTNQISPAACEKSALVNVQSEGNARANFSTVKQPPIKKISISVPTTSTSDTYSIVNSSDTNKIMMNVANANKKTKSSANSTDKTLKNNEAKPLLEDVNEKNEKVTVQSIVTMTATTTATSPLKISSSARDNKVDALLDTIGNGIGMANKKNAKNSNKQNKKFCNKSDAQNSSSTKLSNKLTSRPPSPSSSSSSSSCSGSTSSLSPDIDDSSTTTIIDDNESAKCTKISNENEQESCDLTSANSQGLDNTDLEPQITFEQAEDSKNICRPTTPISIATTLLATITPVASPVIHQNTTTAPGKSFQGHDAQNSQSEPITQVKNGNSDANLIIPTGSVMPMDSSSSTTPTLTSFETDIGTNTSLDVVSDSNVVKQLDIGKKDSPPESAPITVLKDSKRETLERSTNEQKTRDSTHIKPQTNLPNQKSTSNHSTEISTIVTDNTNDSDVGKILQVQNLKNDSLKIDPMNLDENQSYDSTVASTVTAKTTAQNSNSTFEKTTISKNQSSTTNLTGSKDHQNQGQSYHREHKEKSRTHSNHNSSVSNSNVSSNAHRPSRRANSSSSSTSSNSSSCSGNAGNSGSSATAVIDPILSRFTNTRVFAKWTDNCYYPGTVAKVIAAEKKLLVSFCDGGSRNATPSELIPVENVTNQIVRVKVGKGLCAPAMVLRQSLNDSNQPVFVVEFAAIGANGERTTADKQFKDLFLTADQGWTVLGWDNATATTSTSTPGQNLSLQDGANLRGAGGTNSCSSSSSALTSTTSNSNFADVDLDNIIFQKRARKHLDSSANNDGAIHNTI